MEERQKKKRQWGKVNADDGDWLTGITGKGNVGGVNTVTLESHWFNQCYLAYESVHELMHNPLNMERRWDQVVSDWKEAGGDLEEEVRLKQQQLELSLTCGKEVCRRKNNECVLVGVMALLEEMATGSHYKGLRVLRPKATDPRWCITDSEVVSRLLQKRPFYWRTSARFKKLVGGVARIERRTSLLNYPVAPAGYVSWLRCNIFMLWDMANNVTAEKIARVARSQGYLAHMSTVEEEWPCAWYGTKDLWWPQLGWESLIE